MKLNKVTQLANQVHAVLSFYARDYIKDLIGDSTNNNRALSVQQLIRFLYTYNPSLAAQVSVAREQLLNQMFVNRWSNNRNDAYDVHEFLTVLNEVSDDTTFVRSLSQRISKAA